MTIDEVIEIDITGKDILIIGCPASGKSWLAKKIYKPTHEIIHTDKFSEDGYHLGMYGALTAYQFAKKKTIIEGIHGYRMLRKGVEYANYLPDIVINLSITEKRMLEVYEKERDVEKVKYLKQFNNSHKKILSDYFDNQLEDSKPLWIEVSNDYDPNK